MSLLLDADRDTILIGQGVTSPWYVGTTTLGLVNHYGKNRVIDPPVSENGITGVAIGAAIAGAHPILVFPRMDFMYLAMDQIANHAANWHTMFGGEYNVPLTIWAIINRGGEQAAQHSQAIQAIFAHLPGLKVVMPSNGYDAKGLLVSCVRDGNPVMFIDDRWLYPLKCEVPEELYTVPIGKGKILRAGKDVTIITTSYLVHEALAAAKKCERKGFSAEVIDLRTIKPMDEFLVRRSVEKTGRVIIIDGGWKGFGIGAEIAAKIAETELIHKLKAPICRLSLPDAPAPACSMLEKVYYPREEKISAIIQRLIEG